MAEVLAGIGAAAAITQLIRYGFEITMFLSALPRQLRSTPQQIQDWTNRTNAMLSLLLLVKSSMTNLDQDCLFVFEQCEAKIQHIQAIVEALPTSPHRNIKDRMTEITLVFRRKMEIETLLAEFQETFRMLVSILTILSAHRTEENVRLSVMQNQQHLVTNLLPSNSMQMSQHNNAALQIISFLARFGPGRLPARLVTCLKWPSGTDAVLIALNQRAYVDFSPHKQYIRLTEKARSQIHSRTSQYDNQSLSLALRSLNNCFPSSFAQAKKIQDGSMLHGQLIYFLSQTVAQPFVVSNLEPIAHLVLRSCMYRLVIGQYSSVVDLTQRFRSWCAPSLENNFKMATALDNKAAVAKGLQGQLWSVIQAHKAIYWTRCRELGKVDESTFHSLNNIACSYHAIGELQKSMRYHQMVITAKTNLLGRHDPDTILSVHNLGVVYQSAGKYRAAEKLFLQVLGNWSQIYDPDDRFMLSIWDNLGINHFLQGRNQEAERIHRYVLRKRRSILGHDHHETMKTLSNLAMVINARGQHEEAETMYREARSAFEQSLGQDHPDTLKMHHNIATALCAQGKYKQAEKTIRRAIPLYQSKYGLEHATTLDAMEFRAILLEYVDDFVTALEMATDVCWSRQRQLGMNHVDTRRIREHVRDLVDSCDRERTKRNSLVLVTV